MKKSRLLTHNDNGLSVYGSPFFGDIYKAEATTVYPAASPITNH